MKDLDPGPDVLEWLGVRYKTILKWGDTGGAMSIIDTVLPPLSGPPRHIHHDADETFVMWSGQCEFWLDSTRILRGSGETAFVPRGTEHTFRVVGTDASRHLVIMTPGGFEGFFVDMTAARFQIPQGMAAIEESAARHNLTFTAPPLGAEEGGAP